MRKAVFWIHLVTGLSAALVILIMSGSGVLLTYQRQIETWADTRGLDAGPPSAGALLLSPDSLVARANAVLPGRATSVRWRRDRSMPVEVSYGRESRLFVNAYTGEVLGQGSAGARAFFRSVTNLHRWLAFRGEVVARGRALTGAANLAFLGIALCGVFLWWPRRITRRTLRNALLFRRGLTPHARDFNWHNVIGSWSLIPLIVISSSGAVISYGWAAAIVERLAGDEGAATRSIATAPGVAEQAMPGGDVSDASFLLARARAHMPDWQSVTMQWPVRNDAVVITVDGGTGGQPHRQAELVLSAGTGHVTGWRPFATTTRAERVRAILRYVHTGEVFGVAGQTIAGVVSAGVLVMIWTGVALALRRLRRWRARIQRGARGDEPAV